MTHHVLDELSAYIDGEAVDPERIARHLGGCPSCARRYEELSKLSTYLKSASAPDVGPEFAARVMAHARETRPMRWRRFAVPLALAATVLLVALGPAMFLRGQPAPAPSEDTMAGGFDERTLLARIEDRAVDDETLEAVLADYVVFDVDGVYSGGMGDSLADEMIAGLADAEWFEDLVQTWEQEADLDTVIADLDENETETLKQLLWEYEEEDWRT